MVERAKNKYSKESLCSCRTYEIAKKWRGTISHRKIFRRALCFHILRGTRENLFPLRRNKWRRKRRERDKEENLLDSRAVAYTKAFREVHPTGANSRGWAKAFLERKSSRCEKSVAKIEPSTASASNSLIDVAFDRFLFFLYTLLVFFETPGSVHRSVAKLFTLEQFLRPSSEWESRLKISIDDISSDEEESLELYFQFTTI